MRTSLEEAAKAQDVQMRRLHDPQIDLKLIILIRTSFSIH